jgi:hypothetical protein
MTSSRARSETFWSNATASGFCTREPEAFVIVQSRILELQRRIDRLLAKST